MAEKEIRLLLLTVASVGLIIIITDVIQLTAVHRPRELLSGNSLQKKAFSNEASGTSKQIHPSNIVQLDKIKNVLSNLWIKAPFNQTNIPPSNQGVSPSNHMKIPMFNQTDILPSNQRNMVLSNHLDKVSFYQRNVASKPHGWRKLKPRSWLNASYFIPNAEVAYVKSSSHRITTCGIQGKYHFGNQIFVFAALYGIARRNGITPVMKYNNKRSTKAEITKIFQISLTPDPNPVEKDWVKYQERYFSQYDNKTESLWKNNPSRLALCGYFQSWRYFQNVKSEVRKQLSLRPEVRKAAVEYLKQIIRPEWQSEEYVRVGVHVRRGDVTKHKYIADGYNTPPVSYYYNAVRYFRTRYNKLIFILCSNDIAWTKEHISGPDMIYASTKDLYLDFAILSLSDHSIMSFGTFGWWASWLANGTTVYFKYPYKPKSSLYQEFSRQDHFPPHWIPME